MDRECRIIRCGMLPFDVTVEWQRHLAGLRAAGVIGDRLLLVEHPHTFSFGRAFEPEQLRWDAPTLARKGISLEEADRGGGITYHGPGQLVAYPILKLDSPPDLHLYLRNLEETAARALAVFGVKSWRRAGATGVWVESEKIASIGIKFAKGVVRHGVSMNVCCDLSYFDGIMACGLRGFGQTSLERLGVEVRMNEAENAFIGSFGGVFRMSMTEAIPGLPQTGLRPIVPNTAY